MQLETSAMDLDFIKFSLKIIPHNVPHKQWEMIASDIPHIKDKELPLHYGLLQ